MIKVGCIAPCIGIGGADALMLGLTRYCHNLLFTGIAIDRDTSQESYEWYRKASNTTIHQKRTDKWFTHPGIKYHDTYDEAVYRVCQEADVIFTWCTDLSQLSVPINKPIIEYCQNTDLFAQNICKANKKISTHKVACSKAAAKCFIDEDTTVIYNGIDPGRVTPRKGRELQRKIWGIPEHKKILLYMGRMVVEKHPEIALKALPEDWALILAGTGQMETLLHLLCDSDNKAAFVKPDYHVGDLLSVADCYILPSDFEGHPLAAMEAMLASVPVVCSKLPVMEELEDIFGPMCVTCSTAAQYQEAILEATTESSEIFVRINNARTVVWNNFTLPTIAYQWEDYIERAVFNHNQEKRLTKIYPIMKGKPIEMAQ